MLEIVLVRHGETVGNEQRVFFGRKDYPLNQRGQEQARRIAHSLRYSQPSAIYTSPLVRTLETANKIAHYHPDIPLYTLEELMEMDFGVWEGLSFNDISKGFPDAWEDWCQDWWGVQVPGGESACLLHQRVTDCIDKIISQHPKGQVIIVTHLGCIRSLLSHLLGWGKDGYWHFKMPPGGMAKVEIDGEFGVLTALNI